MMQDLLKAIEFATNAHKNQMRKASSIPYIMHPFSVGMILKEYGFENDVVIAGILHDVIEDTTFSYKDIKKNFSKEIADMVQACSENKSFSWEERKKHTIKELKKANRKVCAIISADKLHNIITILKDLEKEKDVFSIFNRPKESQKWYYQSLLNSLKENLEFKNEKIIKELEKKIESLFGKI